MFWAIQKAQYSKFSEALHLDPTGKGLQHPPDSPAALWLFSSLDSSKNWHPQKIAGYDTVGTRATKRIWNTKCLSVTKPLYFFLFYGKDPGPYSHPQSTLNWKRNKKEDIKFNKIEANVFEKKNNSIKLGGREKLLEKLLI